jgi:hypothetical protein
MGCMREWRDSSTILNLRTRWRRVVIFMLLQLYMGSSPQYPLCRRLSGPRTRLNVAEKRKGSFSSQECDPQFFGCPAHSLVAVLPELSQLTLYITCIYLHEPVCASLIKNYAWAVPFQQVENFNVHCLHWIELWLCSWREKFVTVIATYWANNTMFILGLCFHQKNGSLNVGIVNLDFTVIWFVIGTDIRNNVCL